MKVTILVDNNTIIDRYFLGEPGFSAYIEEGKYRILFDTGYSGIFLQNAFKMDIDIRETNAIVLSHGHLDHTWGLDPLIRFYAEKAFEGRPLKEPDLIAHPLVFDGIDMEGYYDIGSLVTAPKIGKFFNLRFHINPYWISEKIVFLGEIPRTNGFEGSEEIGVKEGHQKGDIIPDDSAMVYKSSKGLVIITGCSHSGICNIIEYAKQVCGDSRIRDIIGGFHLLNPSEKRMLETCYYFKELDIQTMHPCHCTDLSSKIALSAVASVEEIGVGLKLEYN